MENRIKNQELWNQSFNFLSYLHSYENRHVSRGIQFPQGGSQVSNRVILNYYIRSVILGHVKERELALTKSRERKNQEEVDRCGCQAGLHEECEIRVLLRETRGRFKDGNIFRRETIFAFAYITSYAYTLRSHISCTVYYLYLYLRRTWRAKYR